MGFLILKYDIFAQKVHFLNISPDVIQAFSHILESALKYAIKYICITSGEIEVFCAPSNTNFYFPIPKIYKNDVWVYHTYISKNRDFSPKY